MWTYSIFFALLQAFSIAKAEETSSDISRNVFASFDEIRSSDFVYTFHVDDDEIPDINLNKVIDQAVSDLNPESEPFQKDEIADEKSPEKTTITPSLEKAAASAFTIEILLNIASDYSWPSAAEKTALKSLIIDANRRLDFQLNFAQNRSEIELCITHVIFFS